MPSYPVQSRTDTTDTHDKEHRFEMKILLTGATGFLGSAILDDLTDRGDDVTVLLRNASRREALTRPDTPAAIGDLSDPDTFDIPLSEFDVVIHSAGLVSDWMDWLHRQVRGWPYGPRREAQLAAMADDAYRRTLQQLPRYWA